MITVGDFCESLGLPRSSVNDVVAALERKELVEIARHEARMKRCANRPNNEALALRDEEGNEFGVVEARIPKTLFFNLMQRRGFGWEGLTSDEGIADILKDNPQCRVKTVNAGGKLSVGWTGGGRTVVKKY